MGILRQLHSFTMSRDPLIDELDRILQGHLDATNCSRCLGFLFLRRLPYQLLPLSVFSFHKYQSDTICATDVSSPTVRVRVLLLLSNDRRVAEYTNLAIINFPSFEFEFPRPDKLHRSILRARVAGRANPRIIVRKEFLEKAGITPAGSFFRLVVQLLECRFDVVCGLLRLLVGLSHYQTGQQRNQREYY
jgi:hypothetical protein